MTYADAADVKAQTDWTNNINDTVLTAAIEAISKAIDLYCGRPDGFEADVAASAREYAGSGYSHLWIDECVEITLVESKSSYTSDYVAWSAADWRGFIGNPVRPNVNAGRYRGLLATGSGKSRFTSSTLPTVRVTARWGYAAQVPPVIKQAVIIEAARLFKRAQGGFSDVLGGADFGELAFVHKLDPMTEFLLDQTGMRSFV